MIGLLKPLNKILKRSAAPGEVFFQDIEDVLIQSDLGVKATEKIMETLAEKARREGIRSPDAFIELLKEELVEILESHLPITLRPTPHAIKFIVGVNGSGKTTTIAKLAYRARMRGERVILVAADTYRAAAIEQLKILAGRVEVDVVKNIRGADPGAIVFDAIEAAKTRGADLVLVDTAGRLHTKVNLMEELKKLRRVAESQDPEASIETLLVMDATTGQNGLSQARLFNEALQIDGIILTKLDGTAKGGIVLAIEEELGIPVVMVGVGEYIGDLEDFKPKQFVEALLSEGSED